MSPLFGFSHAVGSNDDRTSHGATVHIGDSIKTDRKTIDAKLIEEDAQKLKAIEEQRQRSLVPDTEEYNHMKVGRSSTEPCL